MDWRLEEALLLDDRTLAERYRLYVLPWGAQRAVCVASSPDPGGIGVAIVTLAQEASWDAEALIGVMDACPDGVEGDGPGIWLANPYPHTRQ